MVRWVIDYRFITAGEIVFFLHWITASDVENAIGFRCEVNK